MRDWLWQLRNESCKLLVGRSLYISATPTCICCSFNDLNTVEFIICVHIYFPPCMMSLSQFCGVQSWLYTHSLYRSWLVVAVSILHNRSNVNRNAYIVIRIEQSSRGCFGERIRAKVNPYISVCKFARNNVAVDMFFIFESLASHCSRHVQSVDAEIQWLFFTTDIYFRDKLILWTWTHVV